MTQDYNAVVVGGGSAGWAAAAGAAQFAREGNISDVARVQKTLRE